MKKMVTEPQKQSSGKVLSKKNLQHTIKALRKEMIDFFQQMNIPALSSQIDLLKNNRTRDSEFLEYAKNAAKLFENHMDKEIVPEWKSFVGLFLSVGGAMGIMGFPQSSPFLFLVSAGAFCSGIILNVYLVYRSCRFFYQIAYGDIRNNIKQIDGMLDQFQSLLPQPSLRAERECSSQKTEFKKESKVTRKCNPITEKILKGQQQRKINKQRRCLSLAVYYQSLGLWANRTGFFLTNYIMSAIRPIKQVPVEESKTSARQMLSPLPKKNHKKNPTSILPSSNICVIETFDDSDILSHTFMTTIDDLPLLTDPVVEPQIAQPELPAPIAISTCPAQAETKEGDLHSPNEYTLMSILEEEKRLRYQAEKEKQKFHLLFLESQQNLAAASNMLTQLQTMLNFLGIRLGWFYDFSRGHFSYPSLLVTPYLQQFWPSWQQRQVPPVTLPHSALPPAFPLNHP